MKNKLIPILLGILISLTLVEQIYQYKTTKQTMEPSKSYESAMTSQPSKESLDEGESLPLPPISKILPTTYHIFQTFNNCGPAALSMAFSHYDLNVTQKTLGDQLRPYQIQSGDNDDKSVTLEEMAELSKDYGFIPFHRPNGDIQMLKYFISNNIPVITRTWLKANDDIGHYRVVKGYTENFLIQDDSLQGANLSYTYDEFDEIWEKFNYEFLVLIPEGKEEIALQILGENASEAKSWKLALERAQKDLNSNPNNLSAHFNLVVALYNTQNYEQAIVEYEKIESRLPFRTLWYQIEPIQAYYEAGNYEKVFEITDDVLTNGNKAFSELYLLRGYSYIKLNNLDSARVEFNNAYKYNTNSKTVQNAIEYLNTL